MDPNQIKETVSQMQAEYQKLASAHEAMTLRAERAEQALARGAVTKVASHGDIAAKTAGLSGRLVIAGVLPEGKEKEFTDRIIGDPTELYGVCNKLAALVTSGAGAIADHNEPDDPETDGLDPIERFAR